MKKKGSFKSYILLLLIFGVTILITWYILTWFKNYKDLEINSVIVDTVPEVRYDNISALSKERNIFILYACTTNEKTCRKLDNTFSDYIAYENLNDQIFYLNLGYDSDENGYLDKIYNKYKSEDLVKKIKSYPTLLLFSNGKIVDLISSKKNESISIADIKTFIEGYDF